MAGYDSNVVSTNQNCWILSNRNVPISSKNNFGSLFDLVFLFKLYSHVRRFLSLLHLPQYTQNGGNNWKYKSSGFNCRHSFNRMPDRSGGLNTGGFFKLMQQRSEGQPPWLLQPQGREVSGQTTGKSFWAPAQYQPRSQNSYCRQKRRQSATLVPHTM
jgi:hypothetical protein